MDFLRKGVQAAKNVAQQVKEAVEEREITGGLGQSANADSDFETCVRHFLALNTSLKQVGTKAKDMMNAIKAQGQAVVNCAEMFEATCETEFGEDSHWSKAAITLRNMNHEVHSKFNAQLIALIQRDVFDKIAAELESNNDVKATIEARRAQGDQPRDGDEGLAKISGVIRRRKMLLAQCLTALASHQFNYYTRLADKAAPLKQVVTESKQLLGDSSSPAATNEPASASSPSTPSTPSSPPRPTPKQQAPPAQAPPPAPAQPSPPPVEKPPPPPPPAEPEPAPEPVMPAKQGSAEPVDLLGLGDTSPEPPRASPQKQSSDNLLELDVPPPAASAAAAAAAAQKVKSPTGDLLDSLFGEKPNKMPSKGPFTREGSFKGAKTDDLFPEIGASSPVKTAARAKDTGDLLDFGGGPPPAAAASDPLNDLFGPSSGGSKGRGQNGGGEAAVNGDDEAPLQPQKPRASRDGDFKGAGTDRQALKAQFEAHLQEKADAAAAEARRQEEERQQYEDLKFQSQDGVKDKVDAWAGPKHNRKNLRAMLASFETILWDSAREKWQKKGLHELVMPDQVKKIHRKAVLVVHPDKVHNQQVEVKVLAEEVQGVLHHALEEFRKKEGC